MNRKVLLPMLLAVSTVVSNVQAADYPSAPVRIVYPSTPGSAGDVRVRQVAELLSQRLGVRFVVENKPGASGAIGASYAAKSAPNGYTLLTVFSTFVTTPVLMASAGYDPLNDFTAVAAMTSSSPILVVNPTLPVRTLQELIDLAKAKPGSITLGNSGIAGATHLPAILFERAAQIKVVHVSYKGESEALPDVVGGQLSGMFTYAVIALPHIRAGRLRALAVTGSSRNAALPDVPTMAESRLVDAEYRTWLGIVAPQGTSAAIVEVLNREITQAMNTPDMKAQVESVGTQVYTTSAGEFQAVLRRDYQRYGQLIKQLGLRLE
jgi:tripartite-type tricarboxylate transporter receptor subunit TctC